MGLRMGLRVGDKSKAEGLGFSGAARLRGWVLRSGFMAWARRLYIYIFACGEGAQRFTPERACCRDFAQSFVCLHSPMSSARSAHLEGQGDLVTMLMGMTGVIVWLIGIINLLTKSPRLSKQY